MLRIRSLFAVPLAALLTLVVAALMRTRAGARAMALVDAIAKRPALAMAVSAAVPALGSAAVACLVMWPEPVVHDEFSFLLEADTFAHGRLTNPTHPMWQFFESFHIFHQPTYASKYPPAHGLVLAVGQLMGSPVIGVWLGAAMMGAALCWMLYAWVSPRWAFLTAFGAAAQVGITKYWTQTFWGGALAAAGGALVLGAVVRLTETPPRARDSLLLGLGLVVLANTRPFEGVMLGIVALAYLAFMLWRRGALRVRVIAPAAGVLMTGVLAMAVYDNAVTGSWWKLPYLNHEQIYGMNPLWIFQERRPPPVYRHWELCRFYKGFECGERRGDWGANAGQGSAGGSARTGAVPEGAGGSARAHQGATARAHVRYEGASAASRISLGAATAYAADWPPESARIAAGTSRRPKRVRGHVGALDMKTLEALRQFFLGRVFLVPFAVGLLALARPKVMLAAACAATMLAAVAVSTYFRVHYVAPFTGALFAVSAVGMERIGEFKWRDWPFGYAFCVVLLAGVLASVVRHSARIEDIHTSFGQHDFIYRRAEILERLRETPGRDLVVVSYGPHHVVHREWVYNAADIDASDIVWARDMGPERNRELLDYFHDRKVWRLRQGFSAEVDGLTPYGE